MSFGFFKRIADFFSGSASQKGSNLGRNEVPVYLKCGMCGETVMLRLRKTSEIQRNDDRENHPGCEFYVQKIVTDGNSRCPNRMHVVVGFDERYRIVRQQVIEGRLSKGEFITAEEYAESMKKSVEDNGQ